MIFGFRFAETDPGRPGPPPAPRSAPAPDDEPQDTAEDVSEVLLTMLPWGISILFHVGLVLLAIFVVWSVRANLDEEEVIVPFARLSATPGAPLQQSVTKTVSKTTRSATRSVSRSTSQATSALNSAVSTNTSLIGVMGGSAGKANPFGTAIAAGSSFKASFFGTGGNARRIVYLVDASGSLIDTLPFVIVELKRSISELSDKQKFSVFFFQEDKFLEAPPPGLKDATAENKDRVMKWIDPKAGNVVARGRSSPLPALQRALTQQPQLLFILSDNITGAGIYEIDQRRLLAEIERANTSGTKINTIQFLYPDPLAGVGLKATLEMISGDTGGIYKFLGARELNLE